MPRHTYSLQQRIFMYDSYVLTNSCWEVVRLFLSEYPGAPAPHRDTVRKLVTKFKEMGSILDKRQR